MRMTIVDKHGVSRRTTKIPPGLEYIPAVVNVEQVKVECCRRILLIMSENQQRNSLAAMMLRGPDQDVIDAWIEIERLRKRSNEIEMLEPIPADFENDEYWSPQ